MNSTKPALDFLEKLEKNNNREWFNEHKQEYLDANELFKMLTQDFITALEPIDELIKGVNPKDCIFRIYKDVRFSKDKRPYKTHFGAYINQGGRKGSTAGYYLHLEPGNSLLAGGIHMPPSPILYEIRDAIYAEPEVFKAIIKDQEFLDTFRELEGEKLKIGPKGFPKDIDLLKYKSFDAIHYLSDKDICSENFLSKSIEIFRQVKPLNDFFNRAVLAMD